VELIELHIHQRHSATERNGKTISGAGHGVGRHSEDSSEATGGPENGLGVDGVDFAGTQLEGDDATGPTVVTDEQVQSMKLVHEVDVVFDALLVECLQDHVAGAVSGVAGALDRTFAKIARVSSEPALIHATIGKPVEGQAHVLELEHCFDGLTRENLSRILIDEVVTTFDGIEHVPLPVVFFDVAQRRGDAALSSSGVRTWRIEFADDGNIGLAGHLNRGHQSRATRADDDRVKSMVRHVHSPPSRDGRLRTIRPRLRTHISSV
jgi:hypothetical protein